MEKWKIKSESDIGNSQMSSQQSKAEQLTNG